MKKLLLLLAFLICLNSFSQELSNGGIPADGITPILREQKGINFNTVLNKTSTQAIPTSSPPTGSSTEVDLTIGNLSVNSTGGASYSIPIKVLDMQIKSGV